MFCIQDEDHDETQTYYEYDIIIDDNVDVIIYRYGNPFAHQMVIDRYINADCKKYNIQPQQSSNTASQQNNTTHDNFDNTDQHDLIIDVEDAIEDFEIDMEIDGEY